MSSATAVLDPPQSTTSSAPIPSTETIVIEQPETTQNDWSASPSIGKSPTEEKNPEYSAALPGGFRRDLPRRVNSTDSSASIWESEFRPQQKLISLRPKVTRDARQWLTDDLDIINQRVVLLALNRARTMHVQVKSFQVSVKRSWEGEFSELVLEVSVKANLPQSLALWDAIGDSIQRWGERQSVRRRRILNDKYAVFVEPSEVP